MSVIFDKDSKIFSEVLEEAQSSLRENGRLARAVADSISNSYRQMFSYIDSVLVEINPSEKPAESIQRLVKSLGDIKTYAMLESVKYEKISSKFEGASEQVETIRKNIETRGTQEGNLLVESE